jgi:hypothetical protein
LIASIRKVPLTWKNRACPKSCSHQYERHFRVMTTGPHARIAVSADGTGLVSQACRVLLTQTLRVTGLGRGLSAAPER